MKALPLNSIGRFSFKSTRPASPRTSFARATWFVGLVALVGLTTACSDDNFPKYVQLGGLRVLALQAGSEGGDAEMNPSGSVTITPWVSDYQGGSRTVTYTAVACFDRGVSAGAEPTCEGVTGATTVGTGTLTFGDATRTGQGTAFSVTIPAEALIFAGRSSIDRYNGVNYLVTYQLTASDGTTVKSFKRIVVVDSSKTKNKNPGWSAMNANGAAITAVPTSEAALAAIATAGSTESYSVMNSDLSLRSETEELTTTWFITDGSLKFFRTLGAETTTYTPASPTPVDHTPVIMAVMRDGRGGIAVKRLP